MLPFVEDGYTRACKAIRAQVESKYAEQVKAATPEERRMLLKKIDIEVRAMIRQNAPPEALY
jgi:hypothetical protein